MERISRSDLPGKDYTLSLLQMYIKERFENVDYSDIKRQIIRRDKFLKNAESFEKVLEHIDHEVSEWYKSITVE